MTDSSKTIFVTGASGLVGSHVVEEAVRRGHVVRVLVRPTSDTRFLDQLGVEKVIGDLQDEPALREGVLGVDWVINCAAMVGDWGKLDDFRRLNVDALRLLLDAAALASIERFVHVSSLGVYEGRDHNGTDETTPPAFNSLDAYTRSKTEAEVLALSYAGKNPVTYGGTAVTFPYVDEQLGRSQLRPDQRKLSIAIVRPGFIYGERDRTVLPKLVDALRKGRFFYFGSGKQALNCIYVKNLVHAIFLVAETPSAVGEVFNITDGARVTKEDFVGRVAELAGLPRPERHLPLGVARFLAKAVEGVAKARGAKNAPLINKARYKFLGLNLDYSIEKARRVLGYEPVYSTNDGLVAAMGDFMGRATPASPSH